MGERGCAFRLPRVIEIAPQREHQDSGYQRACSHQRRGTVGGISRYEYVLGQNDEQHTGDEEGGRPDGGKRRFALRGLGFRGHGGAFGGLPEPRAALDAEGAAIGGPPSTLGAEGIHAGVLRLAVADVAEGYEHGLLSHLFPPGGYAGYGRGARSSVARGRTGGLRPSPGAWACIPAWAQTDRLRWSVVTGLSVPRSAWGACSRVTRVNGGASG